MAVTSYRSAWSLSGVWLSDGPYSWPPPCAVVRIRLHHVLSDGWQTPFLVHSLSPLAVLGFGLLWSFSPPRAAWFGCVLSRPLAPITVLPPAYRVGTMPERLIKASTVVLVETAAAWSAAGLCTPTAGLHAHSIGPQLTPLCMYPLHGPCGLFALLRFAPPQCASPPCMVWRLGGMACVPCWAPCDLHHCSLRASLCPWLAPYVVCDLRTSASTGLCWPFPGPCYVDCGPLYVWHDSSMTMLLRSFRGPIHASLLPIFLGVQVTSLGPTC
ncbi:hypothetical protein V6N13_109476 [Hibiscus sabdariffa]